MPDAQETVVGWGNLAGQPVEDGVDPGRHPVAQRGPGHKHLRREGEDLREVPTRFEGMLREVGVDQPHLERRRRHVARDVLRHQDATRTRQVGRFRAFEVRAAFLEPLRRRGEGVLARFAVEDGMGTIRRMYRHTNHIAELAVPACCDARDAAIRAHVNPDMLQLVEMTDVPVPPDGVLDGERGRWGAGGCQIDGVALPERGRRPAFAEDRVAHGQRQERLTGIEAQDRRVARGQCAIVGGLGGIEENLQKRIIHVVAPLCA